MNKAQISLEYILITLAVVSILSIIIWQVSNLYSKNINTIDNRELEKTYNSLTTICDTFYLQPAAKEILNINNQFIWNLKKNNKNNYKIYNKDKEYIIKCKDNISIENTQINKDSVIIIEKKDNTICIKSEKIDEFR